MKISQLYVYPIKSLGGIRLNESEVDEKGLKWDRRWVLVDENHVFLSQRNTPALGHLSVSWFENGMQVHCKSDNTKIRIPFEINNRTLTQIKIWDDIVNVFTYENEINEWFSQKIGQKATLCFQPNDSIREIDPKYTVIGNESTSLSDGYPILVISEPSLELLNQKSAENMDMLRFRPNIVVSGSHAHCEDELKGFKVNNTLLYGVKPCARCIFTTIDPQTLEKGKEPLFTLSKYRKVGNKILFGQNVVVHQTGNISVGDKIEIIDI